MTVVGIVGGIASGKSAVADLFRRQGAGVIHADQIGHEVLDEPEVVRKLRARWGDRILDANGRVSRSAIAGIVFSESAAGQSHRSPELRFLESVTHPEIEARILLRIADLERAGTPVIVLDAPILLEVGWERLCDKIVFVNVDHPQRLERAQKRGWTESQFASREATQMPLAAKRKLADLVIDNSASIDHTLLQIQQLWHSLNPTLPE